MQTVLSQSMPEEKVVILIASLQKISSVSDDTPFGAGTFSWQDSVHSSKAGPGEVMTVENSFIFIDLLCSRDNKNQ